MKRNLSVLSVATLVILIASCSSQKDESLKTDSVTQDIDSTHLPWTPLPLEDQIKSITVSRWGNFIVTYGNGAGCNLTFWIDNGTLVYQTLAIDDQGDRALSQQYVLPNSNSDGIEIGFHMVTNGSDKYAEMSVARKQAGPFSNQVTIPVETYFDMKIVPGGKETDGAPAIVGVNDARDASKTDGQGTTVKFEENGTVKVRVHQVITGGVRTLVVSSDNSTPSLIHTICFWKTGLQCWDKRMDNCRSSCVLAPDPS